MDISWTGLKDHFDFGSFIDLCSDLSLIILLFPVKLLVFIRLQYDYSGSSIHIIVYHFHNFIKTEFIYKGSHLFPPLSVSPSYWFPRDVFLLSFIYPGKQIKNKILVFKCSLFMTLA